MKSAHDCYRETFPIQKPCKFRLVLGLVWSLTVGELGLCADDPTPEYASKAGSLALFLDYVKWPTGEGATSTVGILGDDPFGGALDKLHVKRSRSIEDLKDCQIIFVAKSEQENLNAKLEALGSANILTVGESEDFVKQGGIIGFVIDGDKVRFEINTGAARRAGLKIDLRLLKLAVRVTGS